MRREFHEENRKSMYQKLEGGSLVILFSGRAPRKTSDEYYQFFANRNFVYMTGIEQQESVFLCDLRDGKPNETLFALLSDMMAERWNGKRLTKNEAQDLSGIGEIRDSKSFRAVFDMAVQSGQIEKIYLDLDKFTDNEPDSEAYELAVYIKERYPFIAIKNLSPIIKRQRLIKKPCEIDAMREAQKITREGILAMMRASKPGMYEYQYKAEFDYALTSRGVLSPAFPPIISAGANNFYIHYNSYRGRALDGDMVLNDVGACFDNEMNDVSRGWPCNGKFSDKQKLLYNCAFATSEHMFKTLKPGVIMSDVDLTIRKFNFERLKDAGLCDKYEDVGKYMWHGGAHHVGFDVHDAVLISPSEPIAAGMVFCVDIGIYCEEWGIGFRLEDNCLITENGCENLSSEIPRSIAEIEAAMR